MKKYFLYFLGLNLIAFAVVLNVDADSIQKDTSFVDDLHADSLDVFQIIMEIEEQFDIQIPDDAATKIVTVGDAAEQISEAIAGN